MELWSPIRAHAEWIVLLRESLYGEGPLTPLAAAEEDQCELGVWLVAYEPAYGRLPEFHVANEIHRAFHRRAGYCLELARTGRRAEAIAETEENGELRQLSRRLVKGLQSLKRRVSQIDAETRARMLEARPT